ncbi:hypothetical protein LguiB_018347 [Lonicera macranthoides]
MGLLVKVTDPRFRESCLRGYTCWNQHTTKDFSIKILDFALVKRGSEIEKTRISIRVIGTYDYAAPE